MKKIIFSLALVLVSFICNAAWFCYPPYNSNGDGTNCFGSNYNCVDLNKAGGCKCDNSSCCCWGAIVNLPNANHTLQVDEGLNSISINDHTGTVWSIDGAKILEKSNEVFQFKIIEELGVVEFKIYDNNILQKQIEVCGGVDKERAFIRVVKYAYSN